MSFLPNVNSLAVVTLANGALIGVNTGLNGVSVANFKGSIMALLTAPVAIGVAPANYNVRILAAPNADVNIGTPVAQFTLVTNGGPSTQQIGIDTRNLGTN